MVSYWAGVTMIRGVRATVGGLTPAQGCRNTTWSLRAVVKMADGRVLFPTIVDEDRPDVFWVRIQSRTCSGRMSIIRIGPNCGIRCFADHVGVALAGREFDLVGGQPGLEYVVGEGLPAAAAVAEFAGFGEGFGALPRFVGLLGRGKGAGGALPPA
jgi:hypothetical protein